MRLSSFWHVEPPLGVVDQLPLVEQHHDRAAGRVDTLGETLVLAGDALRGVDHEQRDVGVVDRPQRPHERVVLGRVVDLRPPAHARPCRRTRSGRRRSRRACRSQSRVVPGDVVDDGAVLADQPVEQRALADVRPPDDGDPRRRPPSSADRSSSPSSHGSALRRSDRRDRLVAETLEHDVEQVAGAPAVQRAHRDGLAEPERQELPHLGLAAVVVGLVGDDEHLVSAATQPVGDRLVVVGDPTDASTTNSTTSASSTAASTWRLTLASRSSPPGIQPPVSITGTARRATRPRAPCGRG